MNNDQRTAIEALFLSRAKEQKLKPGTVKYGKAECEFFCGAMAALQIVNKTEPNAAWVIKLMSGRGVAGK